jgi:diacylglycerol kinase family enzyme
MERHQQVGTESRPVDPPGSRPSASRRWAAGGALLAAAAALIVVVTALWGDLGWLVVAVVALLVAVAVGWAALVHRGATRVVASIVAVLALLGLVVALLRAVSLVELVVVLLLLAISGSAARYALGHDLARDRPGVTVEVAPARQGVLLMNPWSGGGKVARFGLVAEAQRRGVQPVVLGEGDDLVELAEQAAREGADVLGMAGGDGSQALVADVARRHELGFVCIPAGTRNHFALDLGLDRDDVVAALDAYGTAHERRIDLALIGDRIFVNNASLGVYATVVQSKEYRAAKMSTAVQMLPDLLGPDQPGFDLRFIGPDGTQQREADLVLVSNNAYRLRRIAGFGTRERMDQGVLGVTTVTVDRGNDLAALVAAEAAGRVDRFRGYQEWTVPEFRIESGSPLVEVGVDGEALRLPPPLVFRSLPGALRIRTPINAGASPAAVRPASNWLAAVALVRVLAGRPAR